MFPGASIDAHPIDTAKGTVNEAKLEILLAEIRHRALKIVRRVVRPHDAEDLAQDVVLACLVQIREGMWNGHIARLPVIVGEWSGAGRWTGFDVSSLRRNGERNSGV